MIQLLVDGIFLDLYETDPPKLTLVFDSFETYQPESTYSETFRLPATNNNFQFFQTAYDVNGYDFDVTVRRDAYILIDGAEFESGELRLNRVFISDNNKIDYEVVFLGRVRDLASKLGNKKLNELNMNDLVHTQSMNNVKQSWLAFPTTRNFQNTPFLSVPGVTGLLNGDVLYPLIDFGNIYDEEELTENVAISVGSSKHITQGDINILPIADRIWADRFKPMVRAKYVFDKIFEEAGFTYTSNFISNSFSFQRLYMSAFGNEDSIFCPNLSSANRVTIDETYSLNVSAITRIEFNNLDYAYNPIAGANWNFDLHEYKSPIPGTNTLPLSVSILATKPAGIVATVAIYINGSLVVGSNNTFVNEIVYYYDGAITVAPTDVVTVGINTTSPISVNILAGAFTVTPEEQISISALIEDDYKQIDFLKDILTSFKMVMVPDRINQNNFIIEPFNDFIGGGDLLDWSSKLDISKDVQIEPLFFNQTAEINFTSQKEGDWLNDVNEKTFKENFGDLDVKSNNDLLKGTKQVKVNYSTTPVTEIQGANTNTGIGALVGRDNMVMPHIYALETGSTRGLRKPIKSKTRFLFYNGMRYTGRTFDGLNSSTDSSGPWYWKTDTNTGESSELFPQVTPYEYTFNANGVGYDPDLLSLNLTFQAENGYLRYGALSGGYSLYDQYWSRYISLIYNKYSRRLVANFVLSAEDLYEFNFNDVIFVKDTYYYVERIENIPLGEKTSVKVSLIKLIDYVPNQEGYIPPEDFNIWDTTTSAWGFSVDTWDD